MTAITRASAKSYFETEVWKPIPDRTPYEASNMGNIRNGITLKLIKPVLRNLKSRGHLSVYVGGGRKAKKEYIHRLVLIAFLGDPKDGQIGCHKDDNIRNNRLDNLYWGTYKSNAQDSIRNGTFFFAVGEKNGKTKTSDEICRKILEEFTGKRGEQTKLAKKYGMTIGNVHMIVRRKSRLDCYN